MTGAVIVISIIPLEPLLQLAPTSPLGRESGTETSYWLECDAHVCCSLFQGHNTHKDSE